MPKKWSDDMANSYSSTQVIVKFTCLRFSDKMRFTNKLYYEDDQRRQNVCVCVGGGGIRH